LKRYLFELQVAEWGLQMPKLHLTKSVIDELMPSSSEVVYWDDSIPGFGLKVTPQGRKVFIVLYRTKDGLSRLRKYTIGAYGQTTLAIARIAAQKVLADRNEGKDPAREKRDLRKKVVTDTVEEVVKEYRSRHVNALRSAYETNRIIDTEILSRWRTKSIHELSRRDIHTALDEIVGRGSPAAANYTFTVMRAMFNWAIGRGILEKSPCTGLSKPAPVKSRNRILSDDELREIIFAARRTSRPYGAIVELLALLGQRRSEVAEMTWREVDIEKKLWTIPAERAKNSRAHFVHLAPRALEIIQAQLKSDGLVFSTSSGKPFIEFSNMKLRLDKESGVIDWVLHDLRRTVVSGMASLGIAPHVADKVLNHQSGTISGVAAVYQRHEFLAERQAAMNLWDEHIAGLFRPRSSIIGQSSQFSRTSDF
jgi:integrase